MRKPGIIEIAVFSASLLLPGCRSGEQPWEKNAKEIKTLTETVKKYDSALNYLNQLQHLRVGLQARLLRARDTQQTQAVVELEDLLLCLDLETDRTLAGHTQGIADINSALTTDAERDDKQEERLTALEQSQESTAQLVGQLLDYKGRAELRDNEKDHLLNALLNQAGVMPENAEEPFDPVKKMDDGDVVYVSLFRVTEKGQPDFTYVIHPVAYIQKEDIMKAWGRYGSLNAKTWENLWKASEKPVEDIQDAQDPVKLKSLMEAMTPIDKGTFESMLLTTDWVKNAALNKRGDPFGFGDYAPLIGKANYYSIHLSIGVNPPARRVRRVN